MAGRVELRDLVKQLGIVRKSHEALRKVSGKVQHPPVRRRQFDAEPLFVRGGPRPEIDNDIEYGAADAPEELGLGVRRRLVMKAPEGCLPDVVKNVGLNE